MKKYSFKIEENENMHSKQELYSVLEQIKPLIEQLDSILKNRKSSAGVRMAKENLLNAYLGMKIALDEEMLTEKYSEKDLNDQLINKTLAEAQEIAESQGYKIRVMKLDGDALFGIMDFNAKRINVEVADSFVIDIIGIG